MSMKEISYKELQFNPMTLIGQEWMLITAGTKENGFNTMTASWGHLGSIWNHNMPTAVCYVRPQRYTKEFLDKENLYTLSFYPEEYKSKLAYLGSHSGRDEDKIAATGLTPAFGEGYTYFEEAKLVLVCRKLYQAPLKAEYFIDKTIIDANYPEKDFHDLYIGEIQKVLVPEK
ncbi:MAG: flavin reductase [Lachnospiraceae bacterium]|nr:flavin reductase [Lachnospiraceae bacterium]